MNSKFRGFSQLVIAVASLLAIPTANVAVADGSDDDSSSASPLAPNTYVMTAEDNARQAMTDEWWQAVKAGDAVKANKLTQNYYGRVGSPTGVRAASVPAPQTRQVGQPGVLYPTIWSVPGVVWVQQIKSFYCGPASGYMILKATFNKPSKLDGSALSQTALANNNHMRTEQQQVTDWSSGNFVRGLNNWVGKPGWYAQMNKPSNYEKLASGILQAVYVTNKPLAANTVEMGGENHYNAHPRADTIGHWIIAYAYSSPNGLVTWATWVDPIAGYSAKWKNSAKMFNESPYNMYQFVGGKSWSNGIAY